MKGMFRTILVPHDFSRHTDRALRIAACLVPPPRRLIVLHVANRYANPLVQKQELTEARRRLEQVVSRFAARRHGLTIERLVVVGDPYQQIAKAALDADSIVMCTAGRTGLSHLVIGSVAEKVVRHAPRPVLTFRPGVAWPKDLFARIVVPHDFSRHATRALRLAVALTGRKSSVSVLHVAADLPEGVNRIAHTRIFAAERRRLRRLVARTLPTRQGPAFQSQVESGDPYRHIVAAARKASLIVMCTAGRTGLAHLVIGSVTEKVVRHSPVPVLTFRPRAAAARRARSNRASGIVSHARAARRSRQPW